MFSPPNMLDKILVPLAALILILIPFHALLTVWLSGALGHYTALRLWKEAILLILVVKILWVERAQLKRLPRADILWKLIAAYIALVLVSGLLAYAFHGASLKAFAYGLVIDTRFLVFFAVVWYLSAHSSWLYTHWKQLLLIPAAIVVVFGLLQLTVLPHDFLKHFNYGPHTIPVTATVDQKTAYARIGATLRGANPLGAYLVIIITALVALILRKARLAVAAGCLLAVLIVLLFTYSRSAWIGAMVSVGLLIWWSVRSPRTRRILIITGVTLVIIAAGLVIALRHNTEVENTVFHTDSHSGSSASSNAGHAAAIKGGLHDMVHKPLGSGTGTAGPASTYNNHPARIAENYFIQVGQETGWLGLVLFMAILVRVGQLLWARRGDNTLSIVLLASLIGLTAVNMLSHAWADDTLAYVWWGFAGIALGVSIQATKPHAKSKEMH
jgi:hypothetical protein